MINKESINKVIKWIEDYVYSAGAEGLVFGLSGGLDSAVLAALAKKAFPKTSLALLMPIHSDPMDEEHAILLAKKFNLAYKKIDLTSSYDLLVENLNLETNKRMALANIKPRLRMTCLYGHAQTYNYLLAGATNRSEFEIGYFTKHADSGVDLLPLADFLKSEIRILAKILEVPDIIINKPPSAGLWENQTDEDEMGFSYDTLDKYISGEEIDQALFLKIDRMKELSLHKRLYPPIFKKSML